jgi:hypothetical protein
MWKISEDLHVTEEGFAEASRRVRIIATDEIEDLEEIFPCAGSDDDFVHGLHGATPGKLGSEFRKGNTMPRIQLSDAFVDGREGRSVGVFEHFGHGMIKHQLSHSRFSLARCPPTPECKRRP